MTNKDEEFKPLIDEIFANLENKPKMIFKDLDDDEAFLLSEDAITFCIDKISMELLETRSAFIDFQEVLADLALSEFLYPAVENFANFASSIAELFEGDLDSVDTKDASPATIKKLEHLKKLKAQILSDIYLKYK